MEGASYGIGLLTPDTRINRWLPRLLDQPVITTSYSQTDVSGPIMALDSVLSDFVTADVVGRSGQSRPRRSGTVLYSYMSSAFACHR